MKKSLAGCADYRPQPLDGKSHNQRIADADRWCSQIAARTDDQGPQFVVTWRVARYRKVDRFFALGYDQSPLLTDECQCALGVDGMLVGAHQFRDLDALCRK